MNKIVYLLWSNKHDMWWAPNAEGYTSDEAAAGRYGEAEAIDHVVRSAYCGQKSGVTCMVAAPDNWTSAADATDPVPACLVDECVTPDHDGTACEAEIIAKTELAQAYTENARLRQELAAAREVQPRGWQAAIDALLGVASRTGAPAASWTATAANWAAAYLMVDPDKRGPVVAPHTPLVSVAEAGSPQPPAKIRCPHVDLPSYEPNPTLLGRTAAGTEYGAYALHLDDWHPDWHNDDLDRMAGGLRVEAQQRRDRTTAAGESA
jgi:hypothetical protein